MKFNFSNRSRDSVEVKIENQEIPKRKHFRYVGLMVSEDGELNDDVTHSIKVGWLK